MKQLGNLALICSKRKNTTLQIQNGLVSVQIGDGANQAILLSEWDNDGTISDMIWKLNFGKYAESV